MKKQLLLLIMLLLPMIACADDSGSCGDHVYYTYVEATHTLTISGSGEMNSRPWTSYRKDILSVIILNGVTSIGFMAFNGCSGLTSVSIPNSVTSIGGYAFSGCSGLTSITIPISVTSIGIQAFSGCSGLTSITIPNSVTSIGNRAFIGCSGLTSVSIPNSVTSIGSYAFSGCSGLTSITIPNSVTSIGESAFSGCSGLTSITIPNSVTSIGDDAFSGCSGLTSITIPNSVTSIGDCAFYRCSGLTSVIVKKETPLTIKKNTFSNCANATLYVPIGSKAAYEAADYWKEFKEIVEFDITPSTIITFADANVKAICVTNWDFDGDGEFSKAEAATITSISLGEVFKYSKNITSFDELKYFTGLKSIGDYAFYCCSVTSITIPNSLTSIGKAAFAGCSGLTSITIPNSVTSIGSSAFVSCSGLTSITIPNSVTSIGNGAFLDCSGLTSITISNSVTSIGNKAFLGCSGLTSIVVENGNTKYDSRNNCNAIIETNSNTLIAGCKNTIIPNSVTSIGNLAFSGCSGLTSITIPNSVTSIGESAFSGCSGLTSITIPNSVTSIGDDAFQGCSGLTSVTIENETPLPIDGSTFSNRANATLYVPIGSKASYEAADYWKEFKEIVEYFVPDDIPSLTDAIYTEDVIGIQGVSRTLTVSLKNEQPTNAYSFDLKLPDGVTLATRYGSYVYSLSDRHDGHSVTISYKEASGVYSVAALSLQSKALSGNDGAIITLTLNIDKNAEVGRFPIKIQNAKYSLISGSASVAMPVATTLLTISDYLLGDVNHDGDVDIADAVCIVNYVVGKTMPVFILAAADVNGDGDVDIADAVRIVNLVVGKIDSLAREEELLLLPEPQ